MQFSDFANFIEDQINTLPTELTMEQVSDNLDQLSDYFMGLHFDETVLDRIFKQYHILDPDNHTVMKTLSKTKAKQFDQAWHDHPGLRWYLDDDGQILPVDIDTYLDVIEAVVDASDAQQF